MGNGITVLGIHDGHDAGAALIRDGSVVAAIQEERIVNQKKYCGTPFESIKAVFKIAGIDPSDVSLVTVAGLVKTHIPLKEKPLNVRLYERFNFIFNSHWTNDLLINYLKKRRNNDDLLRALLALRLEKAEIRFIEHHAAHAACAYYQRPWDDRALVLTLDGAGDGICSSVSIGENDHIERIASTTTYNSPSNVMYSEITGYYGLKRWEHEYKIMGMAPYGLPEPCLEKMQSVVRVNPGKPLEFQNILGVYSPQYVQKKFRSMFAEQRFDNVCAAAQKHFEEIVVTWVKNAISETDVHKIACAGGSFLNVKANKLIREMGEVEDVFFYPVASDEGIAVGAALEGYYRYCEDNGLVPRKELLRDIYYGSEFSNDQIEDALKKSGWKKYASYYEDISGVVGEMLAKSKIIARFNGRIEYGPRALGNRSILADPRDLRVVKRINYAIKQRDFWMPFAPAVLDERREDYFQSSRFSPYMIEAFDSTPLGDELIAGLHPKDMTGRPQTVNDWNPGYKDVIKTFEGITGVGGLVNTSFNIHGYPIVGTPEVALWTLENSGLDCLAIGNWLVGRKEN